jgi:hypothetical protein
MSRTFTNLLTHVVFSTKDREPLIVPDLQSELYAYLGGLTRELKRQDLWHQRHDRSRSLVDKLAAGCFDVECSSVFEIEFFGLGAR